MSFVTEPLMIVASQVDLIKDVLLVKRIIVGLGSLIIVFTHPKLFSSNVSLFQYLAT